MATSDKSSALQARWDSVIFGEILVFGPALPGTGFETLPPLAISTNMLKLLKSLGLASVGLGLDCVPFHSGWELVEWRPNLSDLELHVGKTMEICDVENKETLEVYGPQIELNLENLTDLGEPPVKAAGVAPTMVVEVEEGSSVELVEARASVEKIVGDQAEGTGSAPILETFEKELGDQAVEAGGEPAHETVEERTGDEPILMDVEEARTGDVPVLEAEELRTGKEPVLEDVAMGTGNEPIHDMGIGDCLLYTSPSPRD